MEGTRSFRKGTQKIEFPEISGSGPTLKRGTTTTTLGV